ncbi:unnamed protein product [Coregonus sp. 'balchen']|nr:unnamed protein product [Coregonus sp. 'balchen']
MKLDNDIEALPSRKAQMEEDNQELEEKMEQLEADCHAQNMRNCDSQVRALAAYLEMEGYNRFPFKDRQLQSFNQQRDMQEKEAMKQQSIDETEDKKTGLERTTELTKDLQGTKQQELRNGLEDSSTRLQELETELTKAVQAQHMSAPYSLL